MIADIEVRNVKMSGMADGADFSINAEDMGTLADILSDKLYSDKALAVIREYVCNAIDAHAEAGTDKPVEIVPPSDLSPTFSVRDFGRGLCPEDINNIYVKFCKSTKRESNAQIGSFGLGCKSGFAYSDSFTVTSWFEGMKSVYSAQKMADRRLKMIPVHSSPSDEPSGIQISVPVRAVDVGAFCQKIAGFCQYVKNPIKLPESFAYEPVSYVLVAKGFAIEKGSGFYRDCKVLMGNVTYPIKLNHLHASFHFSRGVVIFANIGDVNVSPDREKLEYNDKTIGFLNERFGHIGETIKKNIQDEINKKETLWDALEVISGSNSSISFSNFKREDFCFKGKKLSFSGKALVYLHRRYRGKLIPFLDSTVSLHEIGNETVFVFNDPAENIRANRLAEGINQKFGFLPNKIIVSNDQTLFDGLFCERWNENQIVRDYKPLLAKVVQKTRSPAKVWFYEPRNYSGRWNRIEESEAKVKTYLPFLNASTKGISVENIKYVHAAKALGISYYGVLDKNVPKISSDWVPLKTVVDNKIAGLSKKYEAEKEAAWFAGEWTKRIGENFADVFATFSDQFKKYDNDVYLAWMEVKNSPLKGLVDSFNKVCEILKITAVENFNKTAGLEKIAKAVEFMEKYSLAFGLYGLYYREDITKELKKYIDFLNKKQ